MLKATVMKTKKIINVCGSIIKKESLVPIDYNILKNTYVAEANEPYSYYYGMVPEQSKPNSLFLFTSRFYSLEEVLRIAQNIDSCYMEKVNVATSLLDMADGKYSAIRVKYFPDYEHIHLLKSCCINQGVEFAKKVRISNYATVRVNKCFVLEEVDKGIYLDKIEENKGYFVLIPRITELQFEEILINIRNSGDCELFDAAKAAAIIDAEAKDMVRIYSEKINEGLLKCIKEKFHKYLLIDNLA